MGVKHQKSLVILYLYNYTFLLKIQMLSCNYAGFKTKQKENLFGHRLQSRIVYDQLD